jgi:hypothetical protein
MTRKSSVEMEFNADMNKSSTAKRVRVRVSGGDKVQVKKRWVERNNVTSLKLSPGTYWPKGARVRLVMPDGSTAADGSSLDGDYDHTPGGTFSKTIRVSKR